MDDTERLVFEEEPPSPPAPRPTPRKAARLAVKCCYYSVVALCVAIVLFFGSIAVIATKQAIIDNMTPHHSYLHDASHPLPPVVPIINRTSTFDIGVSIWLKPTEDLIHEKRAARLTAEALVAPDDLSKAHEELSQIELDRKEQDLMYTQDEEDILLYSDVVFRDLKLSDKHVVAHLNYSLPTARFCGLNLSTDDLHATFFLLPHSPSVLDTALRVSSYIPDSMIREAVRSRPFPLGSAGDGYLPSVRDEAIDLTGASTSLVRFSHTPETAEENKKNATALIDSIPNLDDDDESDAADLASLAEFLAVQKKAEDVKAGRKPARETPLPPNNIPLLVTRTELRIYDDVSEYSMSAYNKKHSQLKASSCRLNDPKRRNNLAKYNCVSNWRETGPFQTRVQYLLPPGGPWTSQRGYMPHLSPSDRSHGQLDLLPLPVNRSLAMTKNDNGTWVSLPNNECLLNDTMPVSWRISFSGRTPSKLFFGDFVTGALSGSDVAHNASDWAKTHTHDWSELLHGLSGHRFDPQAHPRRRFVLNFSQPPLHILIFVLSFLYWYYLPNRSGLVVWATAATGGLNLFTDLLSEFTEMYKGGEHWIIKLIALPFILMAASVDISMLWATRKWDVRRSGRFGMKLVRRFESHWERASSRREKDTSRPMLLGVAASILVIYYFVIPSNHFIVPTNLPPMGPDDINSVFPFLEDYHYAFANAVILTSRLAQMLHNRRSKTFAGGSRLAAYLTLLTWVMRLAISLRSVVGSWSANPGFSFDDAVGLILGVSWAWQAATLAAPGAEAEREVE